LKATFYLPIVDNDGHSLAAEVAMVEDACYFAFNGWTFVGYFKGAWKMESGQRSIDTSAVYQVVLETDQLEKLKKILADFKAKTTQEALYLEVTSQVDVYFI
jgi:hypothetical protein